MPPVPWLDLDRFVFCKGPPHPTPPLRSWQLDSCPPPLPGATASATAPVIGLRAERLFSAWVPLPLPGVAPHPELARSGGRRRRSGGPQHPSPPAEAARGVRANRWRGGGGFTGRPPSRLPPLPSVPVSGRSVISPTSPHSPHEGERAQAISAEAVPGTWYNGTGWMRYITALAWATQIRSLNPPLLRGRVQWRRRRARLLIGCGSTSAALFLSQSQHLWPLRTLATLNSGHFVPWPLRPLATSSPGHFVLWPLRPLATSSSGHFVPWPPRPLATSTSGHFNLWPLRPLATSSSGTYECTLYAAFWPLLATSTSGQHEHMGLMNSGTLRALANATSGQHESLGRMNVPPPRFYFLCVWVYYSVLLQQ